MTIPAYPIPLEHDDPLFREMFDYWLSKFDGDRLPARADLDPADIPELLGRINVIAVERKGGRLRFKFVLWGTIVAEIYGRDYTGCFLDEIIVPTQIAEIQRIFERVVETGEPHFWQIPVPVENRDFISTRRLLLPLASDGTLVDKLFAFMIGDRRNRA